MDILSPEQILGGSGKWQLKKNAAQEVLEVQKSD